MTRAVSEAHIDAVQDIVYDEYREGDRAVVRRALESAFATEGDDATMTKPSTDLIAELTQVAKHERNPYRADLMHRVLAALKGPRGDEIEVLTAAIRGGLDLTGSVDLDGNATELAKRVIEAGFRRIQSAPE